MNRLKIETQLDITSLEKAFESLKTSWVKYQQDTLNEFVRDSVIQRFEYTYELSYKMIKRFIKAGAANPGAVEQMFFQDIIREANQAGLLKNDLETWLVYREKRNITSHTYDSAKADDVISIMESFIEEVDFLIRSLRNRINKHEGECGS